MPMIEQLGHKLQTSSVGTLGTNLFLNALPDNTTGVAVAVIETMGTTPGRTFGRARPSVEKLRVQVIARSTAPMGGSGIASPAAARAKAQVAYDSLCGIVNQTVGSSSDAGYYLRVDGVQSGPFLIGRDEKGRALFSCNYDVWRSS